MKHSDKPQKINLTLRITKTDYDMTRFHFSNSTYPTLENHRASELSWRGTKIESSSKAVDEISAAIKPLHKKLSDLAIRFGALFKDLAAEGSPAEDEYWRSKFEDLCEKQRISMEEISRQLKKIDELSLALRLEIK